MTEAEQLLREARDYLITDEAAARAHGFTIVANNRLDLRRRIAAYLARCEKHTETRDEMVMVPREPTAEMIQAWHDRMIEGATYIDRKSIEYALYVECYKAMLSAAKEPQ